MPAKRQIKSTIITKDLGGIVVGPSVFGFNKSFKRMFPFKSHFITDSLSSFGLMLFIFLVGVKMDLTMVKRARKKEWVIGLLSFVTPMILTVSVSLLLKLLVEMHQELENNLTFVGMLQSLSTFHGVACFLGDLNLLSSELGRLAISSSMISGLLSYTMVLATFAIKQTLNNGDGIGTYMCLVISAFSQIIFIVYAIIPLLDWIIRQTPEGEPIKEFHHCLVLLVVLTCALISELFGQHLFFGPMILGLAIPDGSPLALTLINKLDYFVSWVMLPLFFLVSGGKTNLHLVNLKTFVLIEFMSFVALLSKFIGTLFPALYYGDMILEDAITLALIMGSIGVVDVQFYIRASSFGYISDRSYSVLCVSALITTAILSPLVTARYDPSMRYLVHKRRTIQHTSLTDELRLLVCVYNQEHVPNIINILEISNPTRESPIGVYLLHLIELMGRVSPSLIAHQPKKKFSSHPTPSETIINAFRIYERNNQSIVTLQPYTSIAPYATMHDDICTLVVDKRASLVIIPFHRQWSNYGGMTETTTFRNVNLNVLEKAPCSVGILIDRGHSGGSRSIIGRWSLYRVGVFFIGGADDREAMAYAMRMAGHPNVTVTVVRLVVFVEKSRDDAMETKLDNEMISEFRVYNVGSERILFQEENVADSVGIVGIIRSMENSFDLVLVGRRHPMDSPLLLGLTDWTEFPELGFIGDMLASKDFTGKASALVVQQHECATEDVAESPRQDEIALKDQDSLANVEGSQQFHRKFKGSSDASV
ncbi:hypothetical protein L1049_007694 [Liquidambar formosana]|uniref:Cation/H+ exchanger domain-containing protein n=1 Tax=Liquidambar formosana TaxID=63359 RepID=A0AAP0X7Q3_LIQFO